MTPSRVLILTGSYLIDKQTTAKSILLKQLTQLRRSKHLWLELKIKLIIGEILVLGSRAKRKWKKQNPSHDLSWFLSQKNNYQTPDLTEVTLASLLEFEGIAYTLRSYDELFSNPSLIAQDLSECRFIFVSSTYLKDLSELLPIVERLKTKDNHLIVGGALAGTLCHTWEGSPWVDVLAVGYGEYLVPSLAPWIRGEVPEPLVPPRGRLVRKKKSLILYSGVPETLSLDDLPSPDWALAEKNYGRKFSMLYYESVRGCPYRCAFCNYPYLFDDTKFRTKSAAKMIQDWKAYQSLGAEYITCLDSLFTMPKQRLIEFCEGLIREGIKLKWICYARADDLTDEKAVDLLVKSGCIQVQIGIESGDEKILENMNKRTTPEINAKALRNCRKYGLTSLVSLIVGYPGETPQTLRKTFEFLRENPPDFYFLALFSVRVPGVPVLKSPMKEVFGLNVLDNDYSLSPYWIHNSMDCLEASRGIRWLNHQIIREGVSLDASLFHNEMLHFRPELRGDLLKLQASALKESWFFPRLMTALLWAIDLFLKRDLLRSIPSYQATTRRSDPKVNSWQPEPKEPI